MQRLPRSSFCLLIFIIHCASSRPIATNTHNIQTEPQSKFSLNTQPIAPYVRKTVPTQNFVQTSTVSRPTILRAVPQVVYRPVQNSVDMSEFFSVPSRTNECFFDASADDLGMDFWDPEDLQSSEFVLLPDDDNINNEGTFFISSDGQAFIVPRSSTPRSAAGYGSSVSQQKVFVQSPQGYTNQKLQSLQTSAEGKVSDENNNQNRVSDKSGYSIVSTSLSLSSPANKNKQIAESLSSPVSSKIGYSSSSSSQSFAQNEDTSGANSEVVQSGYSTNTGSQQPPVFQSQESMSTGKTTANQFAQQDQSIQGYSSNTVQSAQPIQNNQPGGYSSNTVQSAQPIQNVQPGGYSSNTVQSAQSSDFLSNTMSGQAQQNNVMTATLMKQLAQKYGNEALHQMLQNLNKNSG